MSGVCFRCLLVIQIGFGLSARAIADDDLPQSLDPRLKIELFAESPQIATPTGIDVDRFGRVWAIESNTHFPPEGYAGHPTDRILVMEPGPESGRAEKIAVFKEGLTHSMSIAVKPVWWDLDQEPAGSASVSRSPLIEVLIATRREILFCRDTDGDLKCDDVRRLVSLETTGNYPHNGLAGFAFDACGNMFFGFGENLGADYKIIGSDGTTLTGGGEGGNIYRCRADGSHLERWATGFWNPHANCFDGFGRLFSVDNDPDSRPPCRLLHIVRDGDYGYRFRNGRKGTHPFTAWNGEIPGTLPMVSGTGEAPSGIVAYESDGLPADYRGTLLVGSWGDHRIDKFVLKPRGLSVESMPEPVIKGGENFRPVGLAVAPDGSLFLTDWVLKEYKVHQKGRIWRVAMKDRPVPAAAKAKVTEPSDAMTTLVAELDSPVLITRRLAAKRLAGTADGRRLLEPIAAGSDLQSRRRYEAACALTVGETSGTISVPKSLDLADPFALSISVNSIASLIGTTQQFNPPGLSDDTRKKAFADPNPGGQQGSSESPRASELNQIVKLLALRKKFPREPAFLYHGLRSDFPSVLFLAVQWVGEEKLSALRPEVERILGSEPMTRDLFMACLASLSLLDGVAPKEFEKTPPAQYMLAIVKDPARPAGLRATALRMIPPDNPELNAELLGKNLASGDEALRRETIQTLQFSPIPERDELLRGIVENVALDANLRAEAVAGLSGFNSHTPLTDSVRDLLIKLAVNDKSLAVKLEAISALRRAIRPIDGVENRDPVVTGAIGQISLSLANEPEPKRGSLANALDFAMNRRTIQDVSLLLAEVAKSRNFADAEASFNAAESGRRVFYRAQGAGCYKCHMVGGRGGQVGPDLTVIARTMDRKKLVESILEPSREISPQFTSWAIETKNGKLLTGLLLGEEVNGDLRLGNNLGEVIHVPFNDIESRTPMKASIMPEKLHETMTVAELRDLVTFLETLK